MLIAQMVIGIEFFITFFAPSVNHPNGDCWRGLFSPPKPIAQMAVGGEGPFLFFVVLFFFHFVFCSIVAPKQIAQW